MNAKIGATGDVVRTTTLSSRFRTDHVSWITESNNAVLLRGLSDGLRCLTWEEREAARDRDYDLVINLEDSIEMGAFLNSRSERARLVSRFSPAPVRGRSTTTASRRRLSLPSWASFSTSAVLMPVRLPRSAWKRCARPS